MSQKRPIVADLDFTSVKEDLINYFKTREEFKDYEFTGSGLNLLMDILAYNTHYNALTANMLMNEMFLDTAVLRNNVVSQAKTLNYVPRSATSATVQIVIQVTKPTPTSTFVVIPAGTSFIGSSTGSNQALNFYTLVPYTVQFTSSTSVKNVTVTAYEGKLVTQRFVHTTATAKFPAFDLSNTNIDNTTITVAVNNTKYTQLTPEREGITSATGEDLVYFIEETRNQTHRVVFGNNKIGKALDIGDEIVVSYLITSTTNGNGISNFSLSEGDLSLVSIVSASISSGGAEIESIREIKVNAPRWFQSQYRAVTENDYEVFLKKKYSNIQAISVYGGEKVGALGKVFICIKPRTSDTLSAATKASIVSDILGSSNVVTISPVIVDPSYINIVLKTVLIYDDTLLMSSPDVLEASTLAMFSNFNTEYIGDFLKTFRSSQLAAEIQNINDSIVSSNTRVTLRIDIASQDQKLDKYSFSFQNRLFHPQQGYKAATGGILSTNEFFRVGRSYSSGFDEDGYGKIRLFDTVDGTKIIVNNQAGTINYETGLCEILIDIDPVDTTIQFSVIPDSFDVISDQNNILRIAVDESKVTAIEKNNSVSQKNLNLSRSS